MSGVTDWMASAQVCNLSHMPKLILFDIDGTLVLTGGAGIRAMNRAGEEILGVLNLLDGIPCAGRTDWIILHDALTKAGHELDEALFARMRDAHIRYLAEEIEHPGDGVKDVMPGIRELLPVLQSAIRLCSVPPAQASAWLLLTPTPATVFAGYASPPSSAPSPGYVNTARVADVAVHLTTPTGPPTELVSPLRRSQRVEELVQTRYRPSRHPMMATWKPSTPKNSSPGPGYITDTRHPHS